MLVRSALVLMGSLAVVAQEPTTQRSGASNEPGAEQLIGPGWRWELAPVVLRDAYAQPGQAVRKEWTDRGQSFHAPSGYLFLVLPESRKPTLLHLQMRGLELQGSEVPAFRPLLFDVDGNLVSPPVTMSSRRPELAETRYLWNEVDHARIARFAVGVLDLEGRLARSEVASARARELGASTLPLPRIGQPLPFDLPALDGTRIRSTDFQNRVVIIDSWATW